MRRLLASTATRRVALAAYTSGAVYLGYNARRFDEDQAHRSLPSGFRACCDARALTPAQEALPGKLSKIVGAANVQHSVEQRGSRMGKGVAFAVVKPGTMQEALDALQACVDADACIIPQGANTGLTGASVPRDADAGVDRPTVVINMTRMDHIMPIDDGSRFVCLAGAGIYSCLKKAGEMGKESHSVLGSIFLNPTTAAGVAFGSGGTQLRKGPVFTERLLYARVNEQGKVELVNTLGLKGDNATLFPKLEAGSISQADVEPKCTLAASQTTYGKSVCDCCGPAGKQVSRFNANTMGPSPNRSEGKVLILASVHDTFPKPQKASTLWLSVKDFNMAQRLKRDVCLGGGAQDLPMSCEYMDRDSIRAIDEAGRVLCWMISVVGIGVTLKRMWDLKLEFEKLPIPYATVICDKALFLLNNLCPNALPKSIAALTQKYDHHILLTVGEFGGGEEARFMQRLKAFEKANPDMTVYTCTPEDAPWAQYFRFAAAPAFRTWCIGMGLEGVSVDYALPKGEIGIPPLPDDIAALRMRYSHFGCNVVHEDITFKKGVDAHAAKMDLKHLVEDMGGKLPAEHGHGTEYVAPKDARARWMAMDPLNVFNPGVGGLPVERRYGKA